MDASLEGNSVGAPSRRRVTGTAERLLRSRWTLHGTRHARTCCEAQRDHQARTLLGLRRAPAAVQRDDEQLLTTGRCEGASLGSTGRWRQIWSLASARVVFRP